MSLTRDDRTPVGWVARAIRLPGTERRTLVQAAKATVAAVGSWLLATLVFGLPQPFLAPYAAIFLIDDTVYRSLRGWLQQVGSVTAGVGLAAVVGSLVHNVTILLAIVVFAGLLFGSWRRFGSAGVWVGVTGMLMVTYGSAEDFGLLGGRLLETALGAAVGLVVNVLIFPPLYGERLVAATDHLADALAGVLNDAAKLLREGESAEEFQNLSGEARDVRSLASDAESAAGLTREGRFFNLRRRSRYTGVPREGPLQTLVALVPALDQLVTAGHMAADEGDAFAPEWADARGLVADLLDELGQAVRTTSKPGESADLTTCHALLDRIDQKLAGVKSPLGLGAIALPARRLLQQLAES